MNKTSTKEIKTNNAFYITGITGFLGNHILKEILKNGDATIFAFVLPNDKGIPLLEKNKNVSIVYGNLLNKDDIEKFLSIPSSGDKYLIHCAGKITTLKNGDDMVMKINYEGSKNIVDSVKSKNFKKIVYISSVDALNEKKNGLIFEQDYYNDNDVAGIYGKSKCLANNYFLDNLDNSVLILPSALYGPDDPPNSPINNAINKMITNKLPALVNGGYNLVDVRDCAQAILNACFVGKNKQSYILSGHYISIKELMNKCCSLSNCKKVKFVVPHFIIRLIDPFIYLNHKITGKTPLFSGFSMHCLKRNSNFSYNKAREDLSFSPRDLTDSLKDTILFLKNEKQ